MSLPDQNTRDVAAREFTRNLVITAGAGTGKTSLLVERAVNMILTGQAALDRVVIMTFTKKAAAELRERIADALIVIMEVTDPKVDREPHPHSEADRSLKWLAKQGLDDRDLCRRSRDALGVLESAAVGTIHGFASDLLRRHPVEAGLPPDFTPDDGEERALLLERIWPDFLARELGPGGEAPQD